MFKKLAIIFAIIFLINLVPTDYLIFKIEGDYTFYVGKASSNAEIITVDQSVALATKKSLKNVFGESVKCSDKSKIEGELNRLSAQFVFSEKIDDLVVNYYYSNKISRYKVINGKKINLQTAERNNNFTIGSPLIFGSF